VLGKPARHGLSALIGPAVSTTRVKRDGMGSGSGAARLVNGTRCGGPCSSDSRSVCRRRPAMNQTYTAGSHPRLRSASARQRSISLRSKRQSFPTLNAGIVWF
jgi:hypothetical protein